MAGRYLETHFTPEALAAQQQYCGRPQLMPPQPERDPLTAEESEFIARRDSFYMATVTSNGWPYLQHRGGPAGFLKVLDPQTLGFADFKGNRQRLHYSGKTHLPGCHSHEGQHVVGHQSTVDRFLLS